MHRRTLLKLLAATAMTGCRYPGSGAEKLHVVVAGAGIIGASAAYHLAKAGFAVTVIDKQGPATHASRGTFAWINATWAKQPRAYHALSQEAVSYWTALQSELSLPVRWGGSLEWFNNDQRQEKLKHQIDEQIAWGEPARMIAATEMAELEPNVLFAASTAAYSPNDGAVDPVLATHILLAAATDLGARVHYPSELTGVSTTGGRLRTVETSTGSIAADRLVLATGAAAAIPERIAGVDIPQRTTPGAIVVTTPMQRLIHRIIAAPGVHMHQRTDGRIILGEQSGAPKTEAHKIRLEGRPNDFPSPLIAEQHANRLFAAAREIVPDFAEAKFESAYIGWRPLPIDGHPVLGASPKNPDVYLAIMHSGVTLAPLVGRLIAQELSQRTALDRLSPYRPTREFERVKRY